MSEGTRKGSGRFALLLLCAAFAVQAGARASVSAARRVARSVSAQEDGSSIRPAQAVEKVEPAALILEVARRAKAVDARRYDYTWMTKYTEREVNARGAVTGETVEVYECYPVRGEVVKKLVSRNGVPLTPREAEKELKRATKDLERAERAAAKGEGGHAAALNASAPPDPSGIPAFGPASGFQVWRGNQLSEIYVALWRFLRAGQFYAPRRVSFRGRDAILLDFRPRPDFRPANQVEQPYAKLVGRVWIDERDKAVARLEAWPAPEAWPGSQTPTGGGASAGADVRPGLPAPTVPPPPNASPGLPARTTPAPDLLPPPESAAAEPWIVYEQTRLPDGMWLESLVRIRTTPAPDLFNGIGVDYTKEVSDFRRFFTDALDVKMDEPKKP